MQFAGGWVMVWGDMSYIALGQLRTVKGTLNGPEYFDILGIQTSIRTMELFRMERYWGQNYKVHFVIPQWYITQCYITIHHPIMPTFLFYTCIVHHSSFLPSWSQFCHPWSVDPTSRYCMLHLRIHPHPCTVYYIVVHSICDCFILHWTLVHA